MTMPYRPEDLDVPRVGEPTKPSPLHDSLFVSDDDGVLCSARRSVLRDRGDPPDAWPYFELAGPRRRVFFEPGETTCAIVTCGGLCPGLNDVVRGITLSLYETYGVERVLGLRYGYQGLIEEFGHEPLVLTGESVSEIHRRGGTVLKSSRGQQDVARMVDFLEKRDIDVLFTIGGDGTQRGAHEISTEIRRRGLAKAVVGVPKTIDNDIPVIEKTFGFETAVDVAVRVITCAHIEAHDYPHGVSIVRLMGRDSGFIAAASSIASGDVNICLIPEVPFRLDGAGGLLDHLEKRLALRGHAVIVVAEGAGPELRDAHGTNDIGALLRDLIRADFDRRAVPITLKYIDPSYIIRSTPATADDSVFCAQLAHNAVHAAMSGRTEMVIGYFNDSFVHVPFRLLTGRRKKVDPRGRLWRGVLETTGQPRSFA